MLSFSEALTDLKRGNAMRRTAWPSSQFVRFISGSSDLMYFKTPTQLHITPWPVQLADIQANDWVLA